jgi:type II secretory pathway component PulF
MPEFEFKAVDGQGKFISGVSSAQDTESLSRILQDQGLYLMESAVVGGDEDKNANPLFDRIKKRLLRKRITLKDVAFYTGQLSIMVRSALPILESLEILAEQAPNPTLREMLEDVRQRVSEGTPLSAAFARHPQHFDEIYVSLLAAGEASGDLDVMLDRLTHYLDFKLKLRSKIQSALLYPLIVMLTALAVMTFLVAFVLPTFAEIFVQLSIELPLPTRIVIGGGDLIRTNWYLFPLATLGAYAAFKAWLKRPGSELKWHRFLLAVPLLGTLIRDIVLTRALRTLGSLLEGGVSILRSLELAKAGAGNRVFQDLFAQTVVDVKEGTVLSVSLSRSPEIPRVVIGMIATGEKTGSLPEVIGRVADFYEAESDTAIKNIFTAMEPLFIVGLGLMVGGIGISVLLPMFEMAGGIK